MYMYFHCIMYTVYGVCTVSYIWVKFKKGVINLHVLGILTREY